MKKFIFRSLVVFVCLSVVCISVFAIEPWADYNYEFHKEDYRDGSSDYTYIFNNEQYYWFQLWETSWNNYQGEFLNSTVITDLSTVSGRVRPFGQRANGLNIGYDVGDSVKGGFYMPFIDTIPASITFEYGINIQDTQGLEIYAPDQQVISYFYLYFVDKDGVILDRRYFNGDLNYEFYSGTDTMVLNRTITFDTTLLRIPQNAVGYTCMFTFNEISLDSGGVVPRSYLYFPYLTVSYEKSYFVNIQDRLENIGEQEDNLLEGVEDLPDMIYNWWFNLSIPANELNVVSDCVETFAVAIGLQKMLYMFLMIGSLAAILGIAFSIGRSNRDK